MSARPLDGLLLGATLATLDADAGYGPIEDGAVAALRERLAPEMALLAEVTGLDVGRWGFGSR